MKKFLNILPEILLIIGVFFYWIETSILINPIAIALVLLLSITMFTNYKTLKIVSSVIFGLLSLFMLIAIISEYREFESGNSEGLKMLAIGLGIFVSTFALSLIMGIKELRSNMDGVTQQF